MNTTMSITDGAVPALEKLRRELGRLGWPAALQPRATHPFLWIPVGPVSREYVFTAHRSQPHYTWHQTTCVHPLDDPAGAAERIIEELTSAQRQTLAGRG